ncbi:unnamed protein product [Brachionus calyciflorus]|uniref:MD-2-related lipid-recognition domain-containing protein n=1 Tax=Brachionus calyciflorus TaxID=104777 RepID=A0A813MCH5_9BILA|nr:unnamed protein product [Brachionus calyciflorus]
MHKIQIFYLFFLTFLNLSNCQLTFQDCGSKNGLIKSVELDGCTQIPCQIVKGKDVNVRVKFVPTISTVTLKTIFSGVVSGFSMNFKLPQDDGCLLGADCPTEKNTENQIELTVPIKKSVPTIKGLVRMRVLGDRNKNIICVQMPIETTD